MLIALNLYRGPLARLSASRRITFHAASEPLPAAPAVSSQAPLEQVLAPLCARLPRPLKTVEDMLVVLTGGEFTPSSWLAASDDDKAKLQREKVAKLAKEATRIAAVEGLKLLKASEIAAWAEDFVGSVHCECVLADTLTLKQFGVGGRICTS